jgi:iron complex outermembrane recepter protein
MNRIGDVGSAALAVLFLDYPCYFRSRFDLHFLGHQVASRESVSLAFRLECSVTIASTCFAISRTPCPQTAIVMADFNPSPWSFQMSTSSRIVATQRLLLVPTLMSLVAVAVSAEPTPKVTPAPVVTPISNEVITVTATKQSADEHRLPASVTAVTEEKINQRGAHSLAELSQLSPNLTQFTDKPNGQLSVRGIGSGELPRFGGEENPTRGRHPAVVLYVDGAPVDAERGLAAFDDPLDVQQVEVLRGPQGTLYGRNALGGVVSILSRDPGAQAELDGRIFYGTDNELRASVAGGGPLANGLGLRLAGGYSRSDGSLKNVTTGDDKTASWDRLQARGKMLYQASDVLDLRFTVGGSRYQGSTDMWVPYDRREQRETVTNAPSDDTITGITTAFQADWHWDKATTLTAILGISQAKEDVAYDSDRSALDLGKTDGSNTATTGSLEVRLAHQDNGPLQWLTGVYAARDNLDYQTSTHFSADPIPTPLGNNPASAGTPYYLAIGQAENYHKESGTAATSAALFGEGTYSIDAHWALTLGLRVGYEASTLDWEQQQSGVASATFSAYSGDRSEVHVLPKAALAYHFDDERMIYGSVAEGYRAGGLNSNATSQTSAQLEYDPEYTWNYEIGLRSLWFERAVAFNLTGFYTDWRDQQVFTERAPNDVVETNAARSHVIGAEAELRYRSHNGVSLWANTGVIEAEYDERVGQEFISIGGGAYATTSVDYAGKQFAHIPNFTWALGGAYQYTSGVFTRADVHGHSATYVDDKNANRADAVALFDLRVGYADKWWSVALAGRNLTDETDVLTSITLPSDQIFTTTEPTYVRLAPSRSIGLEASAWW